MPIYEFICRSCGEQFDKLTSFDWKAAGVDCPACHSVELDRAVSRLGGFYCGKPSDGSSESGGMKLNTGSACAHCHSGNCGTCH